MTEPVLSPATQASVQAVVRAKNELAQWTKNLEQALADDLAATPPRLTHEEAAAIAKANGVSLPPTAKADEPHHHEAQPKAETHPPGRKDEPAGHKAQDEKPKAR